ncbi:Acyl-protein thioesterase 1 [Triticum urartu]|uniref:Acyl-protein thioesterase 1 n=1 Tax=Triticum urartu TaxID=4572 RepID=M8AC74_TRIUA|nr:Acyl-protein thioesterase 1 [Triticum urartu]
MEEPPPAEPRSQRAGARWAFPTAPTAAVTCNRGMLMPSWFDIHDTPITSKSVRGEADVLEVRGERARHDRPGDIRGHKAGGRLRLRAQPGSVVYEETEDEIACAGALSIASVLLYPKTLGGCAVFSGFLPFGASFASRVTAEAKKTPVLWVHGRADFLVPIEAGKDGTKFLRGRLGMSCEFKVYDGLAHELAPYELQYCERWADGGGGGSNDDPGTRSVDGGVPRTRRSCSCVFGFFSWS